MARQFSNRRIPKYEISLRTSSSSRVIRLIRLETDGKTTVR
jgi:hypothetical protein